ESDRPITSPHLAANHPTNFFAFLAAFLRVLWVKCLAQHRKDPRGGRRRGPHRARFGRDGVETPRLSGRAKLNNMPIGGDAHHRSVFKSSVIPSEVRLCRTKSRDPLS